MSYLVLPDAQADLRAIDDWVAEHFGEDAASKTEAKLHNTFDLLTRFPLMGVLRPDLESRPVRFFQEKPYWIVYQPGATLIIHRVYHAARNPSRLYQ